MKRSVRIMTAGLAASLALVSCAKQEAMDNGSTSPAGGARTIAVSFANASVKSELNGLQPKFVANDVIKVSNGTDTPVNCTVEIDGSGNATITTELTGALTMVYPAAAAKMNGENPNKIDGVLVPTVQDGTFASANICKAEIAAGATSATFANQTAVLRFYVDASIGVKSITVTSSTSDIATGAKTITVDPAGDVTLDTVTDGPDKRICYVSVLSGVNANTLTLTSDTTTQGTVTRPKSMKDVELAAGTMYNAFIPYYIDLGTAGKWAYCNVGAFLPEDYGDYFMWGEISGHKVDFNLPVEDYIYIYDAFKTDFENFDHSDSRYSTDWDVPKVWDASKGFSDCNMPFVGIPVNQHILEPKDDAACVNWGESWRMPTETECSKLASMEDKFFDEAKHGYIIGVDNKMFLPVVGYGEGLDLNEIIYGFGHYWSSSIFSANFEYAKVIFFDYETLEVSYECRYMGLPVRAIFSE